MRNFGPPLAAGWAKDGAAQEAIRKTGAARLMTLRVNMVETLQHRRHIVSSAMTVRDMVKHHTLLRDVLRNTTPIWMMLYSRGRRSGCHVASSATRCRTASGRWQRRIELTAQGLDFRLLRRRGE